MEWKLMSSDRVLIIFVIVIFILKFRHSASNEGHTVSRKAAILDIKIFTKMQRNHLTEGTDRAPAALHAKVFRACRAAGNEAFFIPHSVFYVLRSNCPSLPVELDYPSTHCRTTALTRNICRIALWLPNFSRRLGDARYLCNHPSPPLDNVLQAAGAWQPAHTTHRTRLIRGGQHGTAYGDTQPGNRRHADTTPIRDRTGQCHSARSRKEDQSAPILAGAMLGHFGRERTGQWGQEVCAADCVQIGAYRRQSQQADHHVGTGARPGTGCDEQTCAGTVRCLVHARAARAAVIVPKDEGHWSGAARHRAIPAARRVAYFGARTTQKIRGKNDTRGDTGVACDRTQAHAVRQGAVDSSTLRGGHGALFKRHAGACSVVLVLRYGQTELVKSALAVGDRNRTKRGGNPASVRTPLGYRTLVSQPETLVGREQFMATETYCAGTLDADSFDSVDTGSVIKLGSGRILPHHGGGTVAQQTTADRRFGGAVATDGIYRTCFQGRFQPEVLDIHLPRTAWRPQIEGVASLPVADSTILYRFSFDCATVPVTQG